MFFYGNSDTGKVRAANQDCFETARLCNNAAICIVCDGMGGAKSGNVASDTAVKYFFEKVQKGVSSLISSSGIMKLDSDDACRILDAAAQEANKAVYKKSRSSSDYQGMGTTLVAALICDNMVYVINVGDSRLYLISDNTINQITHDHSYVQHLIDSGSLSVDDARSHPFRNRITRAVGIGQVLETDIYSIDLSDLKYCYMLLCSDGLSGQLAQEQIYSIISSDIDIDVVTDVETELEDKTKALITAANEAGGPDNITAVLIKYTNRDEENKPLLEEDDND